MRFLAFRDNYQNYKSGLANFLNNYMKENRDPDEEFLNDRREVFTRTIKILYSSIFEGRMDERPGISVLEATMVGLSLNLDYLEARTNPQLRSMYDELLTSEEFSGEKLSEGLSARQRVFERMSTAA